MQTVKEQHFDHSGGVQSATSWLLRATNEVEDVVNGRFNEEIGAIIRRKGYEQHADTLQANKRGLGLYEAKFSTGSKMLAVINNSGDTETKIKSLSGTTWSNLTLPATLDDGTEINFCESLDEAYAAGIDSLGNRISLINIKNDLTTSATRNLLNAPKARFITEYGGALYAINVEVDSEIFPDRAYRSSQALSVITYTRGEQLTLSNNVVNVDTVRYLKTGMVIDIYDHVTDTALYTNLTIAAVDKANDTITLPARSGALTFATGDVNTGTDVITLSSTTNFPTGTPVVFTSSGSVPTGLTADTVYYVINVTGTTIKVATTEANATAGTAIDITNAGSGTHTIHLIYDLPDNSEIYLYNRHGELYYLWNTDYPSKEKSDFLKIPSGASENSAIIGYGKSNNRLFLYTDTTTHRWDNAQLITLFEDIGCANHNTICNVGDWLLWVDSETRVIARNDSTGQKEFISRAIKNKYLLDVPDSNYPDFSAGVIDNVYKLNLGTVNSVKLRLCYDFDSNNWTRDNLTVTPLKHVVSNLSGRRKLYFLDSAGKLFVDDTGDVDDGATIPLSVTYGRNNSGTIEDKTYSGLYVIGRNIAGGTVNVFLNGKDQPIDVGKLTDNYSKVRFGNKPIDGRDIKVKISINQSGDPPVIEGYVPYLAVQERNFE